MFEQNMFRIKSCKPPWLNRELQPRTRACVRTVNIFGWNCKHHFLSNVQNVKQNRGKRARSNYINFRVKGNCEFCAVRREKSFLRSAFFLSSFLFRETKTFDFRWVLVLVHFRAELTFCIEPTTRKKIDSCVVFIMGPDIRSSMRAVISKHPNGGDSKR